MEEDGELESNNGMCEEPLRKKEGLKNLDKPKASISSRNRARKRPDKPLYMPRAARERLSLQDPQASTEYKESDPSSSSCISSSSDSCSICDSTDTESSLIFRQESQPSSVDNILHLTAERSLPQEEEHKLHEAEPFLWDHTLSCFSDMTLEDYEKDGDNPATVPCNAQTDNTITDGEDLNEEIKTHLKEAAVFSIEHVHNDYSVYENVCISPDEFRHVIEIYDFPPVLKTDDLLDAFTEHSEGGLKIKWVDNTHALGVFSSESAALHALSICHPLLKVRALAEGSKKAKCKAVRRAEFIQPVKERPRTDCAVARRMVARALGLRGRGQVQRY